MDSPISKLFFLIFMLRMSKDHRSTGLRWSLPLSGISLGGHGSFLDLLNSCFVFLITSLFAASVAANALLEVSTVTARQWEKPNFFSNDGAWRPVSYLGKELLLFALSSVLKIGGKERITWVSLLFPFSRIFWRVSLSFLNYFSNFHIMAVDVGLVSSGPAWLLGLINGLKSLPFILLLQQITGPNLLWALKAKSKIFGPGLVW